MLWRCVVSAAAGRAWVSARGEHQVWSLLARRSSVDDLLLNRVAVCAVGNLLQEGARDDEAEDVEDGVRIRDAGDGTSGRSTAAGTAIIEATWRRPVGG
eukprot:SAG11_NODE_2395_length_3406_cov_9.604475_4_plen_99_part_00